MTRTRGWYRKRPVEVAAVQWTGWNAPEIKADHDTPPNPRWDQP